ncbi:hypothetical protein DEO72_LG3g1868 [Vigna unguiculata]|uniref:Uncharacterized protein n=1 Tax=Vigna unguiculata TaxID=3917 RepID=A0A4D6LGQ2_VIGUN|nr:hypothetical protein DEO72_LG3g1868 [Vigna unguiculata]
MVATYVAFQSACGGIRSVVGARHCSAIATPQGSRAATLLRNTEMMEVLGSQLLWKNGNKSAFSSCDAGCKKALLLQVDGGAAIDALPQRRRCRSDPDEKTQLLVSMVSMADVTRKKVIRVQVQTWRRYVASQLSVSLTMKEKNGGFTVAIEFTVDVDGVAGPRLFNFERDDGGWRGGDVGGWRVGEVVREGGGWREGPMSAAVTTDVRGDGYDIEMVVEKEN